MTSLRNICVIGAGQMGSGIAQLCAMHGLSVFLCDSQPAQLEKATGSIESSLERLEKKGKITPAEVSSIRRNIHTVPDPKDAQTPDLVIEAIVENSTAKKKLLSNLPFPATTILASNTSSIPITELAAACPDPSKFIGLHFMNPVPIMQLIEVIPGLETDPSVLESIKAFAASLGRTVVESQDVPGFVVNRLLMPYINEGFFLLQEKTASAQDIDTAMKLGTNNPMGPFELADFIGLDTCLAIMETIHAGLGDSKYRPAPLLRSYVAAGRLGRKSRSGVYQY